MIVFLDLKQKNDYLVMYQTKIKPPHFKVIVGSDIYDFIKVTGDLSAYKMTLKWCWAGWLTDFLVRLQDISVVAGLATVRTWVHIPVMVGYRCGCELLLAQKYETSLSMR